MHNQDFSRIPQGRILAIDYGQKRIGLAISDPTQFLASSLMTLANKGRKQFVADLKAVVQEYKVTVILVGLPVHLFGDIGDKAKEVHKLVTFLRSSFDQEIVTWDERWSTLSAEKSLKAMGKSPSKNRNRIDQMAAAFFLQNFLDRLHTASATRKP